MLARPTDNLNASDLGLRPHGESRRGPTRQGLGVVAQVVYTDAQFLGGLLDCLRRRLAGSTLAARCLRPAVGTLTDRAALHAGRLFGKQAVY